MSRLRDYEIITKIIKIKKKKIKIQKEKLNFAKKNKKKKTGPERSSPACFRIQGGYNERYGGGGAGRQFLCLLLDTLPGQSHYTSSGRNNNNPTGKQDAHRYKDTRLIGFINWSKKHSHTYWNDAL